MIKRKNLFMGILAVMLFLPTMMHAADGDDVNGIRVTAKDASGKKVTYDFLFSSAPKLSYQTVYGGKGDVNPIEIAITGNDVKGRYGEDEIILKQENFEKITFIHVDATAIRNVLLDSNVAFKMTGNHGMEISGLTGGEKIGVYTLDGRKVASVKASASGNATVVIPGSESGAIYVVKTGSLSFKVRTK